VYLLAGDVLATWAVAAGIIWEGDVITVSHEIAKRLVLWGVVLETMCSIALFAFDEGISHGQQLVIEEQKREIIALETRLAPRVLSPGQAKLLTAALTQLPRPGLTDIFSFSANLDRERHDLCEQIASVFRAASWNSTCLSVDASAWYPKDMVPGVIVEHGALLGRRQLAESIASALSGAGLSAYPQAADWASDGLCIAAEKSGDKAQEQEQCWRFQIVIAGKPVP